MYMRVYNINVMMYHNIIHSICSPNLYLCNNVSPLCLSRNRHSLLDQPAKNNVFAGPMTYRRFLHCFRHIYREMSQKQAKNLATYRLL